MLKTIIKAFLRKWYLIAVLIPSAVIAYIISLMLGFYIANLYHSDYLGILIMKVIFAVITPTPIAIYWKNVIGNSPKKVFAILVCVLLHFSLTGISWIFINNL